MPYTHMASLQNTLPQAFNATQPAPIVPEAAYGKAYNTTFPRETLIKLSLSTGDIDRVASG